MNRYVILLRGADSLDREAVKAALGYIGYRNVAMPEGSLDAAADSADSTLRKMEAELGFELGARAGAPATAIVMGLDEYAVLAAEHPLGEGGGGPLYVSFLSREPARADVEALLETMDGVDEHAVIGRAVYTRYGKGYEASRRGNAFLEKMLKTPAATRTWDRARELLALAQAGARRSVTRRIE